MPGWTSFCIRKDTDVEKNKSSFLSKFPKSVKNRFVERSERCKNENENFEYEMNNKNRGIAVVLNHENFFNHKSRDGTEVDRNKVESSFGNLGFKVKIFKDLTTEKIQIILKTSKFLMIFMLLNQI